jgi:hypothetical protein
MLITCIGPSRYQLEPASAQVRYSIELDWDAYLIARPTADNLDQCCINLSAIRAPIRRNFGQGITGSAVVGESTADLSAYR